MDPKDRSEEGPILTPMAASVALRALSDFEVKAV